MMCHFTHLVFQEKYYTCSRAFGNDSAFLQHLFWTTTCIPQSEIFNTIHRGFSRKWKKQGDIPYPFGDSRESLVDSSWVIDLDKNMITLRKKGSAHYQIKLEHFLQDNPPLFTDLKPITEPFLQKVETSMHFPNPTWEFNPAVSPRQVALTRRLLDDFAYQWRHVLRSSYNSFTFHQLARAIIRITTLDFDVREVMKGQRAAGSNKMVCLSDLPSWQPTYESIIPLDRVTIIISQHLSDAMELLFTDLGPKRARNGGACLSRTYIVLSVREVFLYTAWTCSDHDHVYTKPEPLLNGAGSPSEKALAYLLMAAPPDHNVSSPLHHLPLELQDMIVNNISSGTLKSAKVACLLSLGSPYLWQGLYGPVKLGRVIPARISASATESQIWFDGTWSGLVYRVTTLPSCEIDDMLTSEAQT